MTHNIGGLGWVNEKNYRSLTCLLAYYVIAGSFRHAARRIEKHG